MRIPRIYQQTEISTGSRLQLDAAASHHLIKVLRMNTGNEVILFNGNDTDYHATLDVEKKNVFAVIKSADKKNTESSLQLSLLLGISKGDRMDISIQKAVELGVHTIVPVITERTVVNLKQERSDKKLNHWQGIIINACEQSGRSRIPELKPVCRLDEQLSSDTNQLKLVLSPYANRDIHSIQYNRQSVSFLIGPEGGLSDNEIKQATRHGYQEIKMGPRILRTETASIATIAIMQALWGDFRI